MAHEYVRRYRQRVDASGNVLAATTASALAAIPDKAKETVYITRIVVTVTTVGAGSLTFRDRANTPVAVFVVASSASVGPYSVEFGDDGFPLTEGKGLDVVGSTNGVVATWKVEAVRRQTSPKSMAEAQASA